MSLYDEIGPQKIRRIVEVFYERCLVDPMLAHFFWNSDHSQLVEMQLGFVSGLLGGPKTYEGRPLTQVHESLRIRPPHFLRRQRILQETMIEEGLAQDMATAWLELETRLRPLILHDQAACRD